MKKIPTDLRSHVFQSLKNAKDNGYDQVSLSAHTVALDLVTYDADLESVEPEAIEPFVVEWQASMKVE